MLRTIQDFFDKWNYESESTLKCFQNLTDESLKQQIPGGRTLGRLANHITDTVIEMPQQVGLPIELKVKNYTTVQELIDAYREASDALIAAIFDNWNDASLEKEMPMYGETWKNGSTLWALIVHQAHHRGQLTALMRFAGLKVPGVYGPSKEEWQAMNMQPLL